jgi:hypothetical protein
MMKYANDQNILILCWYRYQSINVSFYLLLVVELAGERDCEGECTGEEEEEEEEAVVAAVVSPTLFLSLFNPRRDFLLALPAPAAAAVAASIRLRLTCSRRFFFSLSGDKVAAPAAVALLSGDSEIRRFLAFSAASLLAAAGFFSRV